MPTTLRIAPGELPAFINAAAQKLALATTSAEVLDARDTARMAYDIAKTSGRFARAKRAHDEVCVAAMNAQADALEIEVAAKRRLAEEYDAAQDRDEMARQGKPSQSEGLKATAAEAGLTYKGIHEARRLRDAEDANPGITRRTIDGLIAAGEEPTRAALHRAIADPRTPTVADDSLWLWGRLRDFERLHILDAEPRRLLARMTGPMRNDVHERLPTIIDFLERLEDSQ